MDSIPHADIVQALSEKLRANHIFPDVAERICAGLEKHLQDGEYNDLDGELLALALTIHMQEVIHDEHLWVRWHKEPLPEDDGQLRLNEAWQEEQKQKARAENFGFGKVERLAGNVGLLEIRYLHRAEWGGETAHAALNSLADTHALIVDLRPCTGGYPGMIALILSYLFGEERIHLSSVYWRDDDTTQEFWTLPQLPGRRFGEKPVYVLTSRVTFSAGEGFAYILQNRKRALVIGEKTDGGAHPGASYRLHPHFEAFIPIGRTIDPITGTDWEGAGITPDISVPQEQAFTAAYHMALEKILADNPTEEAQAALRELEADKKICPRCGYQNSLYMVRCKNCAETLTE
jgi:hypothetical protein